MSYAFKSHDSFRVQVHAFHSSTVNMTELATRKFHQSVWLLVRRLMSPLCRIMIANSSWSSRHFLITARKRKLQYLPASPKRLGYHVCIHCETWSRVKVSVNSNFFSFFLSLISNTVTVLMLFIFILQLIFITFSMLLAEEKRERRFSQ